METDKAIDRLRELGYEVGVAIEGHGGDREDGGMPTIYRVEGHGISTQVAHDDEEVWASFTNAKAHEHRAKSARAADPNDDFEWADEEERYKSALDAAVATGSMERAEATEALKTFREGQEAA